MATAAAANKRLIGARDLLGFHTVTDPQISPNGRLVAWVKSSPDTQTNGYRSEVWLTDRQSGDSWAGTNGGRETRPRWSPDGEYLAYVGDGQIWIATLHGSEPPRRLTDTSRGVGEPVWSPDGSRIAFTSLIDPDTGLERLSDKQRSDAADPYVKFNQDVLVVTRTQWKSDALGLKGNLRSHVCTVTFPQDGAEPEIRLLTRGAYDLHAPSWSPDGRRLAVVGNTRPDAELCRHAFIYLLDADSGGEPDEVVGLQDIRIANLAWSPDGSQLAVCGHNTPQIGHYGFQRLWLVDVAAKRANCVTSHLDLTFGDSSRNQDLRGYGGADGPRWLPDGSGLLLLVNEKGTVHLAHFDLASRRLNRLTEGDSVIFAFTTDRAFSSIAVAREHSLAPADIFMLDEGQPGTGVRELRQLTNVNEALLFDLKLSPVERFNFESDGLTVEGWVYPPPQMEPGRQYPVILYNGGGPGGMRASVFVHEYQLYAAQGAVVINCNARGNYGYGEAFSTCTRGKWGLLDYDDNVAFVKAVRERLPYADPDRLGVVGGSYGGYMTTWWIVRNPDVSAAVVDRCLVNRLSFNGTSDIGYLLDQTEFDGKFPWDDVETYLERSPLHFIGSVKTPTMVVHSEEDYRCPVEQGEQLFMALKRLGVPTQLVRFKHENHDLSRNGRPWHRVFRLEKYLEWFRRYL